MDYISCNDKRFWGGSDAQTIQNAIDFAQKEHIHEVGNLCITNAKHYSTCFTFCRFGGTAPPEADF